MFLHQVIAFVDALLNCEESGIRHVLVLSPVNAIHNWMNEFRQWIPLMECDYSVSLFMFHWLKVGLIE